MTVLLGMLAAACGGTGTTSTTRASAVVSSSTSATTAAPSSTTSTASTQTHKRRARKHKHHAKPSHSGAKPTSSTTSTTSHSSTTGSHTSKPKPKSKPKPVGPIHATLTAEDHSPKAGKPWPYSVSVTDARGMPLSGTVDIQFAFNGVVVGHDTPPSHPITNGHWNDVLKFPRRAVGFPLTLQAVVHTRVGSATLDWSIKVRR